MDGNVVGFATAVETLAIGQPNGYIKVNGLAVLPGFQHRGIGKMLMERVERLAEERNTFPKREFLNTSVSVHRR